MAYIDPEGMFGGDRMAMLSDGARYAWPWFWCSSNTVGRVKLNYRDFLGRAFRQFKKVPTEDQFWDWSSQFHECFLMFVYQADGTAWGQWDVSARYLPTYKIKADEKTPAPECRALLAWRNRYALVKASTISGKCRIFNNSENFPENQKSFEEFAIGEERRGEDKSLSSPTASVLGGFDRFWQIWWNKTGKKDAKEAWRVATKTFSEEFLVTKCAEYLKRFELDESWSWRVRMHPATWIRGRNWEDEVGKPAMVIEKAAPVRKLNLYNGPCEPVEGGL